MQDKLRIAIITNIIPIYRKGFYDRLFRRQDIYVKVYCQDRIPGIRLDSLYYLYPGNVELVKYISLKKERLAFQFLPWHRIIKDYDVIFISGNPRVLSDLIFGSLLRLIKKRVVLWTMARSYRGNKITENIRLLWARIFPIIFVYTDKEVDYLKNKGFNKHFILGMNNGLDQNKIEAAIKLWPEERLNEWKEKKGYKGKLILLSVGRLQTKNKYALMLRALTQIIPEKPEVIWCLIGDGEEKGLLEKMAKELGINKNIKFIGALFDEEKLAPYFLSAKLFIHPGAIGLSLLHAFGYGLPVITHNREDLHCPEYAAFVNGITGQTFSYNDPMSLADVIIRTLNSREKINEMKINVQKIAREKYNVDVMVERFVEIARYAANMKL
jgi:glycosyltransferase involved in cell wall biosynthesis